MEGPLLYFVFFISFIFRFTNSGHFVWDTLHSNYLRNIEYPYSYCSLKLDKNGSLEEQIQELW